MVVLVGLDGETNNNRIKECGIVCDQPGDSKIVSNVEFEFILASHHGLVCQQRKVGSAIGIRLRAGHRVALRRQLKQPDVNTCRRFSLADVENVSGEPSHAVPRSKYRTAEIAYQFDYTVLAWDSEKTQ